MQPTASSRSGPYRRFIMGAGYLLGIAALSTVALSWKRGTPPPPAPPLDWSSTELVVLTRNAATTFYEYRGDYRGLEYELAVAFGEYLGTPRVRFVFEISDAEVLGALQKGHGHLAVGLVRTRPRAALFDFGPDYGEVRQQVVCHRDSATPATLQALHERRVAVLAGSQGKAWLHRQGWQDRWQAERDTSEEELLLRVARREFDCTVVDHRLMAIQGRFFPELQAVLASDPRPLSWAVAPGKSGLVAKVQAFFARPATEGLLAAIEQRYHSLPRWSLGYDSVTFLERVEARLPEFRALFQQAGTRYGLPWTLLAALSYQESHWDPRARSYTGVRGLMMLTLDTAGDLGVENRLDPAQSIDGGARYLSQLLARIPPEIVGQERLWFALAAYNLGFGHVRDGRLLTERQGGDPGRWASVAEHLPLLTRPRYHSTLEHGYARGPEAVKFVEQVRRYWGLLARREQGLGEVVSRD